MGGVGGKTFWDCDGFLSCVGVSRRLQRGESVSKQPVSILSSNGTPIFRSVVLV